MMFRHILNKVKGYQQYFFVLALVLFALLSSCPIKAGIKSLASEPIKSEQRTSGQSGALSSHFDKCADSERTVMVTTSRSSPIADLLPAVLLLGVALYFFCFTFRKEKVHPLYGNLKLAGSLPLFLEYQQLII